jgi:hypothetical protein
MVKGFNMKGLSVSICKHSKQMIAAICVVLTSIVGQASAPLCSSILLETQKVVSKADIAQAIQGLALLKMNIDIAKTNGAGSATLLKSAYSMKFQELVSAVGVKFSESELRNRITKSIKEIQQDRKSEDTAVKKRKNSEESLTRIYRQTRMIELPFLTINGFFEYLPKLDSIITRDVDRNLVVYDLKNKKKLLFQKENRAVQLSPNRNQVMSIDKRGRYRLYDLINKTINVDVDTGLKILPMSSLNKSGTKVAVISQNMRHIYIIDTVTGQHKELHVPQEIGDMFYSFAFAGERELLISPVGEAIARLNIETGDFSISKIPGYSMQEMAVSSDGKTLSWQSFDYEGVVKISDLENFTEKALVYQDGSAVKLVGNDAIYVRFKKDGVVKRNIYGITDVSDPRANFPDDGQNVTTALPAFDLKSGQVFFRSSSRSLDRSYLEIWELKLPEDQTQVVNE